MRCRSTNMSQRLKKFAPFLRQLNRANQRKRSLWLKTNCSKDFIHCICECAKNILKGKVPLTQTQKKQLAKRKAALRKLTSKKLSLKKKHRIIQKGGFLGAILGPIVSVLGGLLGSKLGGS